MDCEQALALISARLDREILPSEDAWLSDHLGRCDNCRATAEAFALQHRELKDTFKPRRAAVGATADRVNATVASLCGTKPRRRRWRIHRGVLIGAAAGAAWLAAAVLLFSFLHLQSKPVTGPSFPYSPPPPQQAATPLSERRIASARPKTPETPQLQSGQTVTTAAGEHRRAKLPDGSVVFLNENTSLRIDSPQSLLLARGGAFFEVPRQANDAVPPGGGSLVLTAHDRMIVTPGTKFAVQWEERGSRVHVADGDVSVWSLSDQPLVTVHAGEMLAPGDHTAVASPRLSHVVDWTRDLMAAAEPSLVPASSYDGGALIASDAGGQETKLSLRRYHVDVHLEDGFARTTIDQTFFNEQPMRLEGTFYFPLPTDASLSRLAMYVDGQLNEGGMVERDLGRTIFDRIVNKQRDPALLEWVDGHTFKMRVFPLEGRQEKRLLLSYTQRVPTLYGRSQYRFPAGHTLQNVRDWSFHALVKNGADDIAASPTHPGMKRAVHGGDLVLDDAAQNCKVDRDVVLDLTDPSFAAEDKDVVRFARASLDGSDYLMLRYRPQLPAQKKREPRDWIFLCETSADRDPLLARTQIEIVRGLLDNVERDDTFRILAVSNRVHACPEQPFGLPAAPQAPGAGPGGALFGALPTTPDNVTAALSSLEQMHLVGALDLGLAFRTVKESMDQSRNPYLVHVGAGHTGMGTRQDELTMLLSRWKPYVGIGVGKRWNQAFMKECADKTGGYYTHIDPDESISWRTFELMATLNTPRLVHVQVADADQKENAAFASPFLLDHGTVTQGEELCAVAQLSGMPDALTISGTLDGESFKRTVSVAKVADNAGYIPRTWAKLEIDRLLAQDAQNNKDAIVKLSKAMYVMSPFTSLLVLENEEMYKQYNVDRGRKDHWAMYPCPEKIPIVYEPDPSMPGNMPKGERPAPSEVLQSVLVRVPPQWPALDRRPERQARSVIDGNAVLADEVPPPPLLARPLIEPVPRAFAGPEEAAGPGPIGGPPNVRGGAGGVGGYPALDIQEQVAEFLQPPPARFTTGDVLNDIASHLGEQHRPTTLPNSPTRNARDWSVERQHFIEDPRQFSDLLAYAPGLNTSKADLRAVLDAEAFPDLRLAPGRIDPAARRLIDAARSGGWRKVTVPGEKTGSPGEILFDGADRFRYEGKVSSGLHETVVCDGLTLWHLYPEIGLAGRRTVTRFHRAEFIRLLPWLLPPADDLARGADVTCVDANTVAVVPRTRDAAAQPRLHLLFKDNRLVERRLVEMPANRPALRELYDADGGVRILDRDGKEVQHINYQVRAAEAPDLRPDLSKLVVLTLPFRSRKHSYDKLNISQHPDEPYEKRLAALSADDAVTHLTALVVDGSAQDAQLVYARCFAERGDMRRGFFTLLAAAGVRLSREPAFRRCLEDQPDDELLHYLALCDNRCYHTLLRCVPLFAKSAQPRRASFLQELAEAQAHLLFWQRTRLRSFGRQDVQRDLAAAEAFVDRHLRDGLGLALLLQMQDAADRSATDAKPLYDVLAKAWGRMAAANDGAYRARFEQAHCLHETGRRAEAAAELKNVYQQGLDADVVPLLDPRFRAAAEKITGSTGGSEWTDPIRRTATACLDRRRYATVLSLAHQCRGLDEPALAASLLESLLRKTEQDADAWVWRLTVVDFHAQANDFAQAEAVLQPLLDDPRMAEASLLWRLAATLADWRGHADKAVVYLEKALNLEYRHPPDVIVLQHWRADYGRLLHYYYDSAVTAKRLNAAPPNDLVARTLRAVDRWRSYDPEQAQPCLMAAAIFAQLGEPDLAWDYLTTTVGTLGNEVNHWRGVAAELSQAGETALADRALAVASEVDPRNAGVVWQRAQNLRLGNRKAEADKLLRRLVDEKWPPEYANICIHARQLLDGR